MTCAVVDAIEGSLARLELPDGDRAVVPRTWLPAAVREGDHLSIHLDGDGRVRFAVDAAATRAAREGAAALLDAATTEPGDDFQI